MNADVIFGIVFNIALCFILITCGYGYGQRRMRSHMSTVMKEMAENAAEILPIAEVVGGLMPVFTYGSWRMFGNPPKWVIKKHKIPCCEECEHIIYAHRATFTMLITSETASGEIVPVNASMVCKMKNCHCVQHVMGGEFHVTDHHEPDSE